MTIGNSPTLVLIHALAQDARAWDGMDFPSDIKIFKPSVESLLAPLDFGLVADHIVASVEGTIDVVGVAFGGIVAQHIMTRHIDRVRSAVLVNTPAGGSGRSGATEQMEQDALTEGMMPLLDAALGRWFSKTGVESNGPGVMYIRRRFRELDPQVAVNYWRIMGTHNLVEELRGLRVPVTLVEAREDPLAHPAIARLHELLPVSRVEVLEGSHMVHLEYPREFAALVLEHLSWVEDGAPLGANQRQP